MVMTAVAATVEDVVEMVTFPGVLQTYTHILIVGRWWILCSRVLPLY